jgi:HAD superfamily hydrolase (TIGR01509 family)
MRGPPLRRSMRTRRYEAVLFDLGGVLVRLRGPGYLMALTKIEREEDFWPRWLRCPWVRRFERGGCSPEEFATGFVAEWGLPVSPAAFLEALKLFPEGLYEGAAELVAEVRQRVKVGCFSNSNELNWDLMGNGWGLGEMFDWVFLSHLIGRVKPDKEAFDHVVEALGSPPEQVVFVDDNLENVESAQKVGLTAVRARGPGEARSALVHLGVLKGGQAK